MLPLLLLLLQQVQQWEAAHPNEEGFVHIRITMTIVRRDERASRSATDHKGNLEMGVGHDQLLKNDMHTNQLGLQLRNQGS